MKVKVLIPFTDKRNGKTHKKGDVIDVSAERFAEIERPHYITPVVAHAPTVAATTETADKK